MLGTLTPDMGPTQDRVIDIGGSRLNDTLREMLVRRMSRPDQQCVLPSALLSDDNGSMIWRQITVLPDYYQTKDEIALLKTDIKKVRPLLEILERNHIEVDYYGLDLSLPVLRDGIDMLAVQFKHVRCYGLWGTFDDALGWIETVEAPRWLLSLGSILGNDFPEPSIAHLSRWASVMRSTDRMLLGMDGTEDRMRIWKSYHDDGFVFESFLRGGLEHSNRVLEYNWYRPEDWEVVGIMSGPEDWKVAGIMSGLDQSCMHRFVFRALTDVQCPPIGRNFPRGHEIDCYEAFKFGPDWMSKQFAAAGLQELSRWKAPGESKICRLNHFYGLFKPCVARKLKLTQSRPELHR